MAMNIDFGPKQGLPIEGIHCLFVEELEYVCNGGETGKREFASVVLNVRMHDGLGMRMVLTADDDKPLRVVPGVQAQGVLKEVAQERLRQQYEEGWKPDHDDRHTDCVLGDAAAAYCLASSPNAHGYGVVDPEDIWPWGEGFNPKDRRRDLVRAAALIVAEIERLDRAAESAQDDQPALAAEG